VIQADSLSFSYGRTAILKDISFHVSKGETVALLGPNGSGKTTLQRLVLNILKPSSGSVSINGESVPSIKRELFSRYAAYVPQHISNRFPMKVFDAVLMGRRSYMYWSASENDLAVAEKVITELGLRDIAMRDMTTLSGGQRQKAVLARAVAQEADFIIMDEPTSSLDLRHQLETMETVKRLRNEGKGILIAMHDLQLAARNADRVYVISGGALYSQGCPAEVINETMLRDVYGVCAEIENTGCFTINVNGLSA